MRLDPLPDWLDRLGNWNPQLLRELRGKLNPGSILVTVLLGLLGQGLLLLFFWGHLPTLESRGHSLYCAATWQPGRGCPIQWSRWWWTIQATLSGLLPYLLLVPTLFLLAIDLFQEQQKGTLKFLRLSPRSADSLLLGKLLGVPILNYLLLLLLLPLHGVSILLAGLPWHFILSYYSVWLGWGLLLAIVALLSGVTQSAPSAGHQGIAGISAGTGLVALAALIGLPLISLWNSVTVWSNYRLVNFAQTAGETADPIRWFLLPINQNPGVAHLFLFVHLAIAITLFWRILRRAFAKPSATTISKRQSYALVTYLTVFALGWFFMDIRRDFQNASVTIRSPMSFYEVAGICIFATFGFVLLISLLSTPRQMVLDGLRSRQETQLQQRANDASVTTRRFSLFQDELVGEKSSGVLAIGLNLVIFGVLTIVAWGISQDLALNLQRMHGMIPGQEQHLFLPILGLLVMNLVLIANYALLAQIILLSATRKPNLWAFGCLALVIWLPILCSMLFGNAWRWLAYFTPFLWLQAHDPFLERSSNPFNFDLPYPALLAFAILWGLLILQIFLLRWRLRQLRRSL
jgi:ABC-2 family transporter protein